jgi:hypothetical protein
MALNQDFPILDGIAPSWADISINFKGANSPKLEMKDIASIESVASIEVGELRGASGGKVIRTTTGASKYEGKLGLYQSGFLGLLDNLSGSMQRRGELYVYGTVFFDIQQFWTPFGTDEIFEKQINGCRILGDTLASAEGTDAQQVDVPMKVGQVIYVFRGKKYVIL